MKIFNWVHRRFLHVQSGVTSLQEDKGVERIEKLKVDVETHALLEHEEHFWKEGIFAIGTLAIGPLEPKCDSLVDDEDEDGDYVYQDDETNNYVHAIDGYEDEDHGEDGIESSPLMKITLFSHELEKMDIDDDMDGGEDVKQEQNVFDDKNECQVKRRVTLADLFLEESVKETKKGSSSSSNYVSDDHTDCFCAGKKIKPSSSSPTKNGLSKAKKLLKEELRPIKKLNQLMKRMMKKKVHPTMVEAVGGSGSGSGSGGRTQKDIGMQPMKATSEVDGPYESASLLLLQD